MSHDDTPNEVDMEYLRLPPFCSKCIHLLHWFDHRNHICLVSELLGMCVYDFLKENDFQPFPRRHIQEFAKQLLGSVACKFRGALYLYAALLTPPFTVLHELHLVHTDLKPENILLVHNSYRTVNYVVLNKVCVPISCKSA